MDKVLKWYRILQIKLKFKLFETAVSSGFNYLERIFVQQMLIVTIRMILD